MTRPDSSLDSIQAAESDARVAANGSTDALQTWYADTVHTSVQDRDVFLLWTHAHDEQRTEPDDADTSGITPALNRHPSRVRTIDRDRLLTLCALQHPELGRIDGSLIARTAQTPDALDRWFNGDVTEESPKATKARRILAWALDGTATRRSADDLLDQQLSAAEDIGAELVTVLDEDYPANLRLVPDAPPFLFYRGRLSTMDARSIAVVGTRDATADGRARAARMARGLSDAGVVVVSGLARGIDTTAHTTTVDRGHRTIAVIGSGIATKIYPPENTPLAERIINSGGAVISQFWPTDTPSQWRFPARNVTMSGLAQGTVVIEASSTSGAKQQAHAARRHARTVFLLRSLVAAQPWARRMLDEARVDSRGPYQPALTTERPAAHDRRPSVVEVGDVDDIIARLADANAVRAAAELRHDLAYAWPAR